MKIKLTQNKEAIIDDDDYTLVSEYKWFINNKGYAARTDRSGKKQKTIFLHRVINKTPNGLFTDHINKNKLDNRKSNLRSCTNAQNLWNVEKKKGIFTSNYKGVNYDKLRKKWVSKIRIKSKRLFLGRFTKEEDAVIAYNKAAIKFHKQFYYRYAC